jgi:zinc and cadmium transporter
VDLSASGIFLSLLATSIGVGGAAFGVSSVMGAPRKIVPFSGGLLMGIAMFGVLPELTRFYGWPGASTLLAAGVGVLWLFGRYVYPMCPSCSHTHDHDHCAQELHGFAVPLAIAASLHAFLDGVGISASGQDQSSGLAAIVVLGVIVHKIPEGIALGIMLRAALSARWSAFALCAAVESATLFGALLESAVMNRAGTVWVTYALALTGGSFLYLGFHAVHGEWRRRGVPAFMPALTGAAGAAALQQGLRVLFH